MLAIVGQFFISDGYCNQRILKFNAAGRLLRTIPQPPGKNIWFIFPSSQIYPEFLFSEFMSLQVPHGITLLEHLDLLCIADRENMRVVCPK